MSHLYMRRIGALTISQSPRHDLLAPLYASFPDWEIVEVGALDFADVSDLPDGTGAYYPLTTTLNNDEVVTLDQDFLAPLLQDALDNIEEQGVEMCILLCAGEFPKLIGEVPLLKPSDITQQVLSAMNLKSIAVISPIAIQNKPIEDKWTKAGFQARVWTMPTDTTPTQQAEWINSQLQLHDEVACVVLDYVGYPTDAILTLQKLVHKPVFDLGHLAISAISTLF